VSLILWVLSKICCPILNEITFILFIIVALIKNEQNAMETKNEIIAIIDMPAGFLVSMTVF